MVTGGKYLARIRWFNKMNGRQFDEWIMRTWDERVQRVRGGRVEGAVRGAFLLCGRPRLPT